MNTCAYSKCDNEVRSVKNPFCSKISHKKLYYTEQYEFLGVSDLTLEEYLAKNGIKPRAPRAPKTTTIVVPSNQVTKNVTTTDTVTTDDLELSFSNISDVENSVTPLSTPLKLNFDSPDINLNDITPVVAKKVTFVTAKFIEDTDEDPPVDISFHKDNDDNNDDNDNDDNDENEDLYKIPTPVVPKKTSKKSKFILDEAEDSEDEYDDDDDECDEYESDFIDDSSDCESDYSDDEEILESPSAKRLNKRLADQDKKIEDQAKQIAEQAKQIAELFELIKTLQNK